MPTIAELQINLDSRPIKQGAQDLNDFAQAAERAAKASKINNQANNETSTAASKAASAEENLTAMIDSQTRKLEQLAQQRRKLESSNMKSSMPGEYERLNKIIDANIQLVMRQGNAVDLLHNKQERDISKREATLAAELRATERQIAAAERRENVISRAAAREQRQIDATINGLSKQIAAQNQYNEAIEKLNRNRALSGMNGPSDQRPTLSGGEYESLTKLAAARRDAALATEDNSRAITAAQNKLDTFTATLGRAERAEIQYARAVRVLDDNLQKGNITQEQYNQKMERFANHRDRLVAAANSNVAAEERYSRQLQQVLGAYDPVLRATQQYNAAISVLSTGLQTGSVSVEQFNRALTQQRAALDSVKEANTGTARISNEYDQALKSVLPYRTELANLEIAQRRLDEAKRAGLVTTPKQIRDYEEATASIRRQTAEYEKNIAAGQRQGNTFKQNQAALRGLPAQFTDIVVSLQGGQAPLTVLLQQGGQIKDQFGGVAEAFRGVGRGLLAIITPINVALAAFAGLAIGAHQGSEELVAFNRAVTTSRNAVGLSVGDFTSLRTELESTGASSNRTAEALNTIASNSNIARDGVQAVAEAALYLNRATGAELSKTVDDFASLGKEPVEAAVRLDAQYRFLTASVLAQANALVNQGKEQEAVLLLQNELANAVTESSKKIIEDAGYVERAWIAVKDSVVGVFDAIRNIGRDASPTDELNDLLTRQAEIQKNLRGNESALGRNKEYQENENQIRILRIRIDQEKQLAQQQAEQERIRIDSVSAQASSQRRHIAGLEGVSKAENDLKVVRLENEKIRKAGNVSDEQEILMKANLARAEEKLTEAKEKANKPKRPGTLDTTNVTEVRSNLSLINSEYDGYYKRVTALGEANVVSAEATYRSQLAILQSQREAVSKSYDDQISAINKLQENKKNSTAQNISLANQETKAEDAKAKALEQIDAKLDVLQTREVGRVAERTRNIAAYKAALDSQLENLREAGSREADGVGRGDRNAALNQQLGQVDRTFERQQRELANSLSEGMDLEEYSAKLRDLTENHTKLKDQIISNDREIQSANQDWTNGFMSALENAEDQALDFAGSTKSALEGAFNASGQALATFVTTGKFGFKSFASSVIADMARIAAQQAASGILSSILRFGVTAASAYFGGGGGNGLEAGSAGYNSSNLGASQGGYGPQYFQAKGGAWSGGTQMFAQGGAFTNSIVSTPTSFGMANGARGIMGEAGDEAIVPLARTRNGDLGVRMLGGGGNEGGNVTVVNVNVNVAEGSSSGSSDGGSGYDQFGANLGQYIRGEIYNVINTESRPGGTLSPTARQA